MSDHASISQFARVVLDDKVAEALDLIAEGMGMTRDQAARYVIREHLIALGALDHHALEDDIETVGNA